MKKKLFISVTSLGVISAISPNASYAHCPLCTLGAGAAAVGAGWLGVEKIAIGVMLGGFSVALGLWMSGLIHKQYVKYQKWLVAAFVALTTVIPLMPMFTYYGSVYIRWFGPYGSLFNRTYAINLFAVGLIIGASIMLAMPYVSRFISSRRGGRTIPYQGVSLSVLLLIVFAAVLQVAL